MRRSVSGSSAMVKLLLLFSSKTSFYSVCFVLRLIRLDNQSPSRCSPRSRSDIVKTDWRRFHFFVPAFFDALCAFEVRTLPPFPHVRLAGGAFNPPRCCCGEEWFRFFSRPKSSLLSFPFGGNSFTTLSNSPLPVLTVSFWN